MAGPVLAADTVKIVINKKVNKLAYVKNEEVLKIFPVATGKTSDLTPEGNFKVVRKIVNPYYSKLKIPGGSPRNPLGARWLGLDALGTSGATYGIHGTNNPKSIGTYASAGCIRMYNQDVIWLYDHSPLNTLVEIINRDWDLEKKRVIIKVDGQTLDQAGQFTAYLEDNRAIVPCRLVGEAMGCTVAWDAKTQSVVLSRGGIKVTVTVNSSVMKINDTESQMETPAVLKEGKVFLHVRPLAEACGYRVEWDGGTSTVLLNKEL